MTLALRKPVSAMLAAILSIVSPVEQCWAAGAGMAKTGAVKTGLPIMVPGAAAATAGLLPQQGAFSGIALTAAFAPAVSLEAGPAPLPWSSGDNEALLTPAALPDLTVLMRAEPAPVQPAQTVADAISGVSRDIAPMLEELGQDKTLASEGSRETGEGIFQRLLGIRFHATPASAEPAEPSLLAAPAMALSSLSPKIKVTPVSEHLPGVFFVKFLRGTTLEVMLSILTRNGVEPEIYADNGDGFRARVALADGQAGPVAKRLAGVGQVESVEVNSKVYGMLRAEGASAEAVPAVPASPVVERAGSWKSGLLPALIIGLGQAVLSASGSLASVGVSAAAALLTLPEVLRPSSVSGLSALRTKHLGLAMGGAVGSIAGYALLGLGTPWVVPAAAVAIPLAMASAAHRTLLFTRDPERRWEFVNALWSAGTKAPPASIQRFVSRALRLEVRRDRAPRERILAIKALRATAHASTSPRLQRLAAEESLNLGVESANPTVSEEALVAAEAIANASSDPSVNRHLRRLLEAEVKLIYADDDRDLGAMLGRLRSAALSVAAHGAGT